MEKINTAGIELYSEEFQHSSYKAYYSSVFKTAYYIVKDKEIAKELTNEAFFKAFKNIDSLDDKSKFKQWICVIAANLAKNHIKKNAKITLVGDIEIFPNTAINEDSVSKVIETEETRKEVQEALAKLDPDSKEILILRYYNDLPYKYIADHLGLKMGTVKARINRAKEKVYKLLTKEGDLDG
ncbi:MAG: polymerase, sigma-24 subunit, subfamily [Anaerosolibacter sp.]|jgi:RNA polymerase sigma-70 factor (ECF subfamily)|uniref:RNA polymerase sigma factor n=1 Tax=Anaerosolibacter sp. TaxID=1872527 RepID=UPI00260E3D82|nr:RNA polymerase sigma factor [Anaerosolibacter sp.]MDF2548557.1 polymerase, sigma-24 subunit, subfamily [Anaerosolibacter sp.]